MTGTPAVVEPIAVIGMAGRFPAAADVTEFWDNLAAGRDCIAVLDDEDLRRRGELPEYLAHPDYVRRRPCVPAADEFDPRCFGMTPREAEIHDPQFRLLLEVAHGALEHAGYDPARCPGPVGVFAGTNVNRYRVDHLDPTAEIARTVSFLSLETGNAPDYPGTFVAHRLGLRGPSMTVQTACSTGLTAVHLAALSLRAGDCDLALAAAASIEMPLGYGYLHIEGSIYAPDGVPRPFDADAEGTNFGSGAGAVVLKRLDAALADRDTVLAVIRGSGLNNDGDRKPGFTAPSAEGQAECIADAIRQAGLDPTEISYVEAHATGTKVGDPIEVAGLTDAFRRSATGPLPSGQCWIGSVKGNVGHLGPAAGICGLIKTVLALRHQQIPPSINVTRVNPRLNLDQTPFRVATETVPWPRTPGAPRRAGVSAFGIGGTNAHVVLEEAPPTPEPTAPTRDAELIVWSGADRAAADALRRQLADHVGTLDPADFHDVAYTLRVGRSQRRHRGAVVARDPAEAARKLRASEPASQPDEADRQLVFCFPGQGAQHPGMGRRLYESEPAFREHCDEAFALAADLVGDDLRARWQATDQGEALTETGLAQPLLYIIEYALARTLQDWGLRPSQVFGHSVGELVAATVAGVLDLASGLRAITARGRLMQQMPRGGMLAVAAAAERVRDHLNGEVALAAVNDDRQCVLSGPVPALAGAAERLAAAGVRSHRLRTSHAFHSPAMGPAAEQFAAVLRDLPLRPPATTLVSCATGEPVTAEQATDGWFWARQLVEPVYFARAAGTVCGAGPAFLVEVGPGHTLTELLRAHPEVRAGGSVPLPTLPKPDPAGDPHRRPRGADALEELLGRLWAAGHPVDLHARDTRAPARRVPAPGYPYQRRRFWVERPPHRPPMRDGQLPVAEPAAQPPAATARTVETGPVTASPPAPSAAGGEQAGWSVAALDWVRCRDGRPAGPDRQVDGAVAVVVLPGDECAPSVRTAFQRAGYRTVLATAAGGDHGGRSIGPVIDTGSASDWDSLLARGDGAGPPAVVAHAGLLDLPPSVDLSVVEDQLSAGYFSVVESVRAIARARRGRAGPVTLALLTRWSVDVTGAEPVNPATAMVHGLARTVEQEYPGIRCVIVDLAAETPPEVLSDALGELTDPGSPSLVALRGAATWTPVLRRVPRTGRPGRPRLRAGGVYLVTGGLGGIGLVVAKALADTGLAPRLALLGRSGAPPAETPQGAAVAAELTAIEDAGAEVMVVTGDVADPVALDQAFARVAERFGPVNGVIHAAGVAGGQLLERRGRAEAERVFAAKVQGTLALQRCLAGRPEPDFLLLCSSQASLTGMVGSADYAAANSFLNAFASRPGPARRYTTAVAWPGWSEVGMLAASPVRVDALAEPGTLPADRADGLTPDPQPPSQRRRFDPAQDWELDEHRFAGTPILPGTSMLELAVTAARSLALVAPDTPVELRDTVFVSPLTGASPVEVSVVFTPQGDGHRFRVQSRPADSTGTWRHHTNGVVTAGAAQPAPADLDQLRSRLAREDTAVAPVGASSGSLELGPRWQTVTGLWAADGEYLAELTLPPQFHPDLRGHPAHPALLDRASLIVGAAAVPEGEQYLPFLYRRVTFFAPLPARIVVHGRHGDAPHGGQTLDSDLYDATSGEHLVSIRSYLLRAVPREEFGDRLADEPAPDPTPADPTQSHARSQPTGLSEPTPPGDPALLAPEHGAAAFLELLDGAYPPVVLVTTREGEPTVAGAPWREAGGDQPVPPAAAPAAPAVPAAAAPAVPAAAPAVPAAGAPSAPAASPDAPGQPAAEGGSAADLVSVLRTLWTEALGTEEIGIDDDFFELGGNSLVSVQLSARIRARFGVELSAGALFQASTIRQLSAELTALGVR